ncbi:MAG: hypothetical protein AAGH42_13535, partial [Pseudomonadota bacterium]
MNSGFRPDLKDRARRDFMRARRFEGDGNRRPQNARVEFDARVLGAAKERIHRLRQKLTVHIGKNKERWVHAETTRLARCNPQKPRHGLADGPRAPFGLSYKGPSRNRSLYEQARANVEH